MAVEKLVLPTYPEPAAEEMPMFAENRVHQRSSGRPYPNKVVMEVERSEKIDKEYTVVRLENDYVCIEILPEIGGRVYSAKDKITGYDYFYKQHVIKPALIGVLGSWISGGVEFNWPFHHRASGFMPCDFTVEELEDGSAICWLSEHDPIDRMKGMVGIVLKPDCSYFETRMKLYNRTEIPRSFLWWENAAVPVNEDYRIFFPQDVSYVNFHYLKSRAAYPVAGNTVFNGIPMLEDRDISWHKNTREATSYFASASDFDFFGGYDYGKQCGVVHIGDHHISPGKKMFTWAYGQLSRSWEKALTDTDGAYAELMAGSYSDNQPNFSWLAPYETKQFSQYWYPISQIGCPTFANLNFAFSIDRSGDSAVLQVLATSPMKNAQITVSQKGTVCFVENGECAAKTAKAGNKNDTVIFTETRDLSPKAAEKFSLGEIPEHVTVKITCDGKLIGVYTEQVFDQYHMPDPITDTPAAEDIESVQELYLAGVHVDQYRDPAVMPDAYWLEALRRDPKHIPSLISMARYEYRCFNLEKAKAYIEKAIRLLSVYNERPQSGEAYYVQGLILEAAGEYKKAYDSYRKAAWAADSVSAAMTRVCVLDLRNGDAQKAADHAVTALEYSGNNSLATAVYVIAQRLLGDEQAADSMLAKQMAKDPLDHMARYLAGAENLYDIMDSSASQTCLDLAFDLSAMGQYEDVINLLEKMMEAKPEEAVKMVLYTLGYYAKLAGKDSAKYYQAAGKAPMGKTFPFRYEEMVVLKDAIAYKKVAACEADSAELLLGDLLYNKLHYSEAAALWEKLPQDAQALRNLAVAYFSHEGRQEEALPLMKKAMELRPDDSQLLYEIVVLMDKLAIDPAQKVELLTSRTLTRDDLITELAKAYNQCFQPDKAIETLMSHTFVPCEGGEHAIADQYLFAHLIKGVVAYKEGKTQEALELFTLGQTLPDNLGAGIWNHCKLIPLKYHQALCLRDLGNTDLANQIFEYIAGTKIEYFSNMHLKELPYYQACSHRALGQKSAATQLITHYLREWEGIAGKRGSGYFGTTPFFISFVDDPQRLRSAQHLYLTSLCYNFMGNQEEYQKRVKESVRLNNENLFALGAAEGYLFCK